MTQNKRSAIGREPVLTYSLGEEFVGTFPEPDALSDAFSHLGGRSAGKSSFLKEAERRHFQTIAKEKELDRAEFLASPNANSW